MPATIKDIARHARVSTATVSLSLRDDQRILPATRKRVARVAAKLGYVPSNLGRALQSRRSSLVGFLLADVTTSFYSEILQGAGEAATTAGYGLLLCVTSGSVENAKTHLKLLREKRIDGLIVSTAFLRLSSDLLAFENAQIPVVVCSNDSFSESVPGVVVDNRLGGEMATEHLIRLGHRRIAYCFKYLWSDMTRRHQGCANAAKRSGVPIPASIATERSLLQALKSPNRPTAVVAYSDLDAIRVLRMAAQVPLRVPEDLSVVGFDDLWPASQPEYDLTTIAQPRIEIGRHSMELLLQRLRGEKAESVMLKPRLVVRGSTAAPPPEDMRDDA